MEFAFEAELIHWRGPSPWHFVAMTPEDSADLREVAAELTYGWGVIPVRVRIGETEFSTSLFPRDDVYLVPVKAAVRRREGLEIGDPVAVTMTAGGQ